MILCINCFVSSLIAHLFMNNLFRLGLACLLNQPETKAQVWLIYKQTNINELFIELNSNCSWTTWFIYSPKCVLKIKIKSRISYYFHLECKLVQIWVKLPFDFRAGELISYHTGQYGRFFSYRWTDQYQNPLDSYHSEHWPIPNCFGLTSENWMFWPVNLYRAGTKFFLKKARNH